MAVTLRQLYTGRNHTQLDEIFLLARAYYRTGQLAVEDWLFVPGYAGPIFQAKSVFQVDSPEVLADFYNQVLPRLDRQERLILYALRLQLHLLEATTRILGRSPAGLRLRVKVGDQREETESYIEETQLEGLEPEWPLPKYLHHQENGRYLDITNQVTPLGPEVGISTVERIPYGPTQQRELVVLTLEEQELIGVPLWSIIDSLPPSSLGTEMTLRDELPLITPAAADAAWRNLLPDPKYLVMAYLEYRGTIEQLYIHYNHNLEEVEADSRHQDLLEKTLTSIQEARQPGLLPILDNYLYYLYVLLWNSSPDFPLAELDDEDAIFHLTRPPIDWNLKLDSDTQNGLSHILTGYISTIPDDTTILRRLAQA